MKYIVGLGNPTAEYEFTRHNIGFMIAECAVRIAARRVGQVNTVQADEPSVSFLTKIFKYLSSVKNDESNVWKPFKNMLSVRALPDLYIIKPQTYMNLSGEIFAHLQKTDPENILVVVDDIYLPLGRFRFRGQGSSGGHNGLKSIEKMLQSSAYNRLKVGVGAGTSSEKNSGTDAGCNLADYVLGNFEQSEKELLHKVVTTAAESVFDWYFEGVGYVQQKYNGIDLKF